MTTTTGIKLDQTTRQRLHTPGVSKDRSTHWLMKRAIVEYLEREECSEREKQEDLRRWQQYQDSHVFISHDDMRQRLHVLAANARERTAAS